MRKTIIIFVIIVVLLAAAVFFIGKAQAPEPTISPTLTQTQASPTPSINYYQNLPGIASCSLKGTIHFLNHQVYNNGDASFSYKGVDHPARNIFWKVTPTDTLSVGPNIFDSLPLPDGTSLLTISLPTHPVAKRYTLTASMQSGRLVDGNIKVSVIPCKGATTIILP